MHSSKQPKPICDKTLLIFPNAAGALDLMKKRNNQNRSRSGIKPWHFFLDATTARRSHRIWWTWLGEAGFLILTQCREPLGSMSNQMERPQALRRQTVATHAGALRLPRVRWMTVVTV